MRSDRSNLNTLLFLILGVVLPAATMAQVVFSTGVQEFYDSNIFLEDDLNPPLSHDEVLGQPLINKYNDGDVDDDYITSVYLRASGAPQLSRYVGLGYDVRGGALFFANNDSEDRLTLDSLIRLESEEALLREPWHVSLQSQFSSGPQNVATAEGSASRQAETHDATLEISLRDQAIAQQTTVSTGYALRYHDFLGEWLTNDNDERDSSNYELQGSDYLENRLNLTVRRQLSPRTDLFVESPVSYLSFTNVESNALGGAADEGISDSELDRIDYMPALGMSYLARQDLSLGGRVGLDYTYYTNEPSTRTRSVVTDGGIFVAEEYTPDRNETSLFFSGDVVYSPLNDTALQLSALQSAGTDIDGRRVMVRTFSLSGSQMLSQRTVFTLSGQYSQFENGDSLSNATDRIEAVAAIRFALTNTLAVQIGYNYVQQNSDDEVVDTLLYGEGDYESHRAFITLDTGFVGLPS